MNINTFAFLILSTNIILYFIGFFLIAVAVIIVGNFFHPPIVKSILRFFSIYRSLSAISMVGCVVFVTSIGFCFLINHLFNIGLKENVLYYVGLTTTSIILGVFGDRLIGLWHTIHERKRNIDLSLKILNQKRFRYFIFLVYFVLLIISTINSLNDNLSLNLQTQHINRVVFQSFATYIAFDRLQSNWKSLKS